MSDSDSYRIVSAEITVLVDDYSGFTRLLAEHGFSALVSILYSDGTVFRVLLDSGSSGSVLIKNASSLGVSLESVDVIALSHRHYDHSGGLSKLIATVGSKPVIAHPDVLRPCYSKSRGFTRFDVGMPPAVKRSLQRLELVLTKKPTELAPGVWFLGEVDRYYDSNYAIKNFRTTSGEAIVDELLLDDTAIAVSLGEKAIVIAGCSHSGIANIVRQAKRLTGAREIVVLGGFHLVSADSETISRVVEELVHEGVVDVYAGHCTGLRGEARLLERFGDRMTKIHSGYRLRIEQPMESRLLRGS
ncbi:MAG: MBL fold metallo-hydrolase [Sulfolobales archaeon]